MTTFNRDGWPVNPDGKAYTHKEIITNPAIPLPQHVNPNSPYWRRCSLDEYEAKSRKAAKKQTRRTHTYRSTRTWSAAQVLARSSATLTLVERVNGQSEPEARFVNGQLMVF